MTSEDGKWEQEVVLCDVKLRGSGFRCGRGKENQLHVFFTVLFFYPMSTSGGDHSGAESEIKANEATLAQRSVFNGDESLQSLVKRSSSVNPRSFTPSFSLRISHTTPFPVPLPPASSSSDGLFFFALWGGDQFSYRGNELWDSPSQHDKSVWFLKAFLFHCCCCCFSQH